MFTEVRRILKVSDSLGGSVRYGKKLGVLSDLEGELVARFYFDCIEVNHGDVLLQYHDLLTGDRGQVAVLYDCRVEDAGA